MLRVEAPGLDTGPGLVLGAAVPPMGVIAVGWPLDGGSSIFVLLRLRGPADVAWLVVTIGVRVTIETVLRRRSVAHVHAESDKVIDPGAVDGDPTTSPVGVVWRVLVEAPIFHGVPSHILRRVNHAVLEVCGQPVTSGRSKHALAVAAVRSSVVVLFFGRSPTYPR